MSAKRPKPVTVGRVKCYAARGPQDGRWYWRVTIHRDGERKTLAVGWWTRREVEIEAARLVADAGPAGPAVQAPPPQLRTLRDVLECWIHAEAVRPDLAASTLTVYRNGARVVVRLVGDTLTSRVGADTLARLRDLALREGYAANTVRMRFMAVVIKAWRWAEDRGHVPARNLRRPKAGRCDRVITDYTPSTPEAWRVIDAMRDGYPDPAKPGQTHREPPWIPDALAVLLGTGLRIGELAGLRWDAVDLEAGWLVLPPGKTKVGRRVPIGGATLGILAARPRDRGTVLGVTPQSAISGVRQALRRFPWDAFGLTRWTPHGLRRAACDALMRTPGIDLGTYAAWMGHSPATALAHYRRASDADLRQAAALAALGEREPSNVVSLDRARAAR